MLFRSCGHGAAIKYVDKEQLFFIQSRGVDQEQAQELLVNSFLSD